MFHPHFEILPPPQLALWPELAEIPGQFVLYGEQYNPMITVKSLSYFEDGDLHTLSPAQKESLQTIANNNKLQSLPLIQRVSQHLADRGNIPDSV
jgi:hypothetical protein